MGRCCFFGCYILCLLSIRGNVVAATGENAWSQETPQLMVVHDDRYVMVGQENGLPARTLTGTQFDQNPQTSQVFDFSRYNGNDAPTWYQGQSQGGDFSEHKKFSRPKFSLFSSDFFWSPKKDDVRLRNSQSKGIAQQKPSGINKPSMLQGATVATSYLPNLGSRGLGMTQIRVGATMGLPGIGKNCFLLVSPSFEPTFIDWDGPEPFPDTLYTASLGCTMIKQLNERWGVMLSAAPRWSSDGHETQDAFGCPVIGGFIWNRSPRLQIRFGVAYLDRNDDLNVLPFGGLVWQPNDDWKYELMVPQLRVMRRCHFFGSALPNESESKHWAYVGIGFGGGTWAFEGVANRADVARYKEYSLVLGFESERKERLSWKTEFGYVFGREMEFDNGTMRDFDIGDTIMFRLTLSI